MEQVTFFATRTLARAAVVDGVKFKDMGADAPKGERWAVIADVQDVKEVEPVLVDIPNDTAIAEPRPVLKAPRRPAGKVYGKGVLINGKRQKVETIFKRNKTTVMIAAAIRGLV